MAELTEFIRPDAIKSVLLDEEAKFNWHASAPARPCTGLATQCVFACWSACNSTFFQEIRTCSVHLGAWTSHSILSAMKAPGTCSSPSTTKASTKPSPESKLFAPAENRLHGITGLNFRPVHRLAGLLV